MKSAYRHICLIILFLLPTMLLAEENLLTPCLLITHTAHEARASPVIEVYRITDDLELNKQSSSLNIRSYYYNDVLGIDDIESFGIGYFDTTESLQISGTPTDTAWTITNTAGIVIAEGSDGKPALSSLKTKEIYLITIGSKTFKYVNLK